MKLLFVLPALSILIACSNDTPRITGAKSDTVSKSIPTNAGPENDPWFFKKTLKDPSTPKTAKDIFHKKWKYTDDEPLEYLTRLHGPDKDARPFYFKVATNLYNYSDGALAEGLGRGGYEYVKQHPQEFTNYFVGKHAFPEKDLQTWAEIILLEFQIITEVEFEDPRFQDYLIEVRKNCNGCTGEQLEVIGRLEKYMRYGWAEFLRNT